MATLTLRSAKGSPLTNNEVDANFTNLNTDKYDSFHCEVIEVSKNYDTNEAVYYARITDLPWSDSTYSWFQHSEDITLVECSV